MLAAFETAIIFVLKRKAVVEYLVQQQAGTAEWSRVGARLEAVEESVESLEDELKALKLGVRHTKTQIESIISEQEKQQRSLSFPNGNNDKKMNKKNDVRADDGVVVSGVDCAATNNRKTNKQKKKFQQHSCFIC